MPEFAWRAANASGEVTEGRLEAASIPAATAGTASAFRGTAGGAFSRKLFKRGAGPVTQAEVLTLTSELSIMLRAGLPLASALRVLIDMSLRPPVAAVLQQV